MKHIALISFHTCPLSSQEGKEVGGMNVYVLELAKELGKKGYIVDIFTRNQGEKAHPIVDVSKNVRVIHITAGPQEPLPKKALSPFIDTFTEEMLAFVANEKETYDLIHAHYYLSGIIGLHLKKQLKIPLVTTFHTLALMKNLVARSEDEKEDSNRIAAEQTLMKESDMIVSPSETDKAYMQYLYTAEERKIVVVTPGVNTHVFFEQNSTDAKKRIGAEALHKLLLFVGRIEPLKGIDVLLYAMKILSERNPSLQVCLWIVGGDLRLPVENRSDELKKLENLKKSLDLSGVVTFVGRKSSEELAAYYNAAELVVAPSQYESFGMTALEAMACGTPVITTDVTGVSDLLDSEHETLVTSANNPLLLADQVETLLTRPELYKEVSITIRKKVQDLDWAKVADKVIMIYTNLEAK